MATAEERLGPLPEEVRPDGVRPEVVIRSATVEDVEGVAAIEKLSFSNPWHPQTFHSLVEQRRALILVAEEGGEIVGYAVVWWVMEQGELANLAVRKERQGRGIGAALLDRVLGEVARAGVESLFLEVRVSNVPARALYASRGFRKVSVRSGYYRNPVEDAWVLLREVGG